MTETVPPTDRTVDTEESREPRILHSEELFAGERIVVIEHDGTRYRLLITRNNRLILHK